MSNNFIANLPPRYAHSGSSKSGGMGDVIFCTDTQLQRPVAIKTMQQIEDMERLEDEIAALTQLRSKHVVQVFDIIKCDDGSFGIVMEFIDGDDLFDIGKLIHAPTDLLKFLWQIASGIADVHATGIIHRDIKPNNMKLDREGIVKIFDFGLARNSGDDAKTVGFKGTIGFAAPEQYTNEELTFTSAIDVYAFGIMALYLATNDISKPLLKRPPDRLPANSFLCPLLKDFPILIDMFEKCLSHTPEDRPCMSHVRDQISKYLLFNKHQAIAVLGSNTYLLNHTSRSIQLNLGIIGSFKLNYDGLDFALKNVIGEVYVNNMLVTSDRVIPGACVVALGAAHRGSTRKYITFDISNPEVTL
ncbi:MAG: serine/threonine protein kinase [Cocleimonas sp.]|jgi:serine/threonine protein kinase